MQNNVTTNKNASGNADTSESAGFCTNTHAPWRVAPSGNAVCTAEGTIIAKGLDHEINDPDAVTANARLIASAPELYATLSELVAIAQDRDAYLKAVINNAWLSACEVLAKVRGEAVDE